MKRWSKALILCEIGFGVGITAYYFLVIA